MDPKSMSIESKLDAVRIFAAASGETQLLDMFSSAYLTELLPGVFLKASPGLILDTLRKSAQTRLEVHRLEREMDHSVFKTLVTSGYLARSGRDKETGEVVFWYSLNALSDRKTVAGSPKGKAYVRANMWLFETVHVQTIDRYGLGGTAHTLCIDLQGGLLDFNPWITEHALNLLHDLFPYKKGGRIYIFGLPKVLPWVFNCAFRVMPDVAKNFRTMEDYDDALDIVENPDDVPEFWLVEDAARDKYAHARTSTWCYERCLSDTNKVTTKDVFNPDEWPCASDEDHSPVEVVEKDQGIARLEVIDEDDEESEDS